uniref:DNA2/NAM7 helicase helicase domain-containing protein n=2 Tax=Meloidogyne incognita group TaxID=654580 RepID=A0A914LUG2_MELIC
MLQAPTDYAASSDRVGPVVLKSDHVMDRHNSDLHNSFLFGIAKEYISYDNMFPQFYPLQNEFCHVHYDLRVMEKILELNPFELSSDQKLAVKRVLLPHACSVIQGMPGTGKTHTMNAAILTALLCRTDYLSDYEFVYNVLRERHRTNRRAAKQNITVEPIYW